MINKIILIFIAGLLESLLYTMYLISIDNRKVLLSTILMFIYMSIYLIIISFAIKDLNSLSLLLAYSLSSALGNYIIMNKEKNKNLRIFKHRPTHSKHSPNKRD
jgi:multidrug transporter EmrE-like cation transporter